MPARVADGPAVMGKRMAMDATKKKWFLVALAKRTRFPQASAQGAIERGYGLFRVYSRAGILRKLGGANIRRIYLQYFCA